MGRVQEPLPAMGEGASEGVSSLAEGHFGGALQVPPPNDQNTSEKLSAPGLEPATLHFNNDTCK